MWVGPLVPDSGAPLVVVVDPSTGSLEVEATERDGRVRRWSPTGWTLDAQPNPVFAACFPVILGIVFMVNARKELAEVFKPSAIPKGNKDQAFFAGAITHLMFILGIIVHSMGVMNLALGIGYPVQLALLPPFATLATLLVFMAVTRTGICGAPGFNFPPVPGVIGLPIILGTLLYNAYTNWDSYGLTDYETTVLAALVAAPVLISQGLGAWHRSIGYSNEQVAKDVGQKIK